MSKIRMTYDGYVSVPKGTIGEFLGKTEFGTTVARFEGFNLHNSQHFEGCENGDCWNLYEDEFEFIDDVEVNTSDVPTIEQQEEAEKAETTVYTPVDFDGPKKLIVIYVDKEMTTKQCIAHARTVEEHLGNEYRVLVVDRKVTHVEVK